MQSRLKAWLLTNAPAGKMAVHSTLGSLGTNLCQVWSFPVASGQTSGLPSRARVEGESGPQLYSQYPKWGETG